MPQEHASHAPIHVVHDASANGTTQGRPLCVWYRFTLRHCRHRCRELPTGQSRDQLALQGLHQLLAILYSRQLLVDSHGRSLSAQPCLPCAVQGRQFKYTHLRCSWLG